MFEVNKKKYSNECLNTTSDVLDEEKAKKTLNHFGYNVVPFLSNEKRYVRYEIYLKHSVNTKSYFYFNVDKDGEICSYSCNYCNSSYSLYKCKHYHLFLNMLINSESTNNQEELEEKFIKLEELEKQKIYEAEVKKQKEFVEAIIGVIKRTEVISEYEKKHIDCYLSYKDDIKLSIRVGDDKKYVVGNLYNFIYAVQNNELVTYGKKYSFVHSIDSFDENAKKVIEFLFSKNEIYSSTSLKAVTLTISDLDRIFKLCEKTGIYLSVYDNDYKYYQYVENNEEPRLFIDKDLSLKLDNCEYFIPGFINGYLLKNNTYSRCEKIDRGYRKIASIVSRSREVSFKYIKDIFENEIYPRFSSNISVDKSLKLKEYVYKIKAYFDESDEGILLETKYFCNDQEIARESMSKASYNLLKYDSFIENLGFKNNVLSGDINIAHFLKSDLSELQNVCEIYLSDKIKAMQIKKMSRISTHLSYNVDMMKVCFKDSEFSDEELELIIKKLRKKSRFIKLNKNTIIEVDEEDANKLLNTVKEFNLDIKHLNKEQDVPLYQALKVQDSDLLFLDFNIDESLTNLINEIVHFKDLDVYPPLDIKNVMRSYQIDAFKWMKTLIKYGFCGILADDMGLGKTLEVISILEDDDTPEASIIVCPKSLCYNWKNEFSLWTNSGVEVINVVGNTSEREEIIKNINVKKKAIYISSYDSLRNDIALYKNKKFRYMILDEAQSIKNHETLKAKSVKMIKSTYRFVLTGTPIENSIIDLWSIFDFLMPEYLGSYTEFRKGYEEQVAIYNDEEIIKKLVMKIAPFILRRTKKEVLSDLPDKIETIQIAQMADSQRKIYDAQLLKTRKMLKNPESSKIEILSSLTRLRQICVDPSLFVDEYKDSSCKIDLVMEIIKDYTDAGHKIILFSQFTSVFEILEKKLKDNNISYFVLTGKTKAEDRVTMANKFNDEEGIEKVFLVSLKAGGTGLNLVGADIVIHLDPWWNYAVENQATDRAHRIGQKNSVQVIKVICEDSIEQKVIELQQKKKMVADKVITSDKENEINISLSDISYLLD